MSEVTRILSAIEQGGPGAPGPALMDHANIARVYTRSDVYSLGVLLYELLTGTTPFDSETLRKAGFDEMRRIIREDGSRRTRRAESR